MPPVHIPAWGLTPALTPDVKPAVGADGVGRGTAEARVVAAWRAIDRALRTAAAEHSIATAAHNVVEPVNELQRAEVRQPDTVSPVTEARRLGDSVVHGQATRFDVLGA